MTASPDSSYSQFVAALPETLRQPALLWLQRMLRDNPDAINELNACGKFDELLRLVACSEFAGTVVLREWRWFVKQLQTNGFSACPDFSLSEMEQADKGEEQAKSDLRRLRNREMLRILWRDLHEEADLEQTMAALSELADYLIGYAVDIAAQLLRQRFGDVIGGSGRPVSLLVLAMGKLGGRELNYSSDVDLIFLHAEDGTSDGARQLSAHEYFTRMSRQVASLLDESTADGFVYRVDTRLRPFGDSGPPVVSFAALESYLVQHGRGWERYAYVKSRVIGTAAESAEAGELMRQLIVPFVYRRYLDYGVFESLREMKSLISAEVAKHEMAENIKLGPGGIREVEFIVQSLQLVRGGADTSLQTPQLMQALPMLAASRAISDEAARELTESYCFLRRLENFLQAIRDQQTHDLPQNELDRARIAFAMGVPDWSTLATQLGAHREKVAAHFAAVAFRGESETRSESERVLMPLWRAESGTGDWQSTLQSLGYEDADDLARTIVEFRDSAELRQLGKVAAKRVATFVPNLLLLLRDRKIPDRTLRRVFGVVRRILRRSAYIALLNENPSVLGRLVSLCENSAFLAEEVGRFPLLLDEMLDPRLYSAKFTADELRDDLQRRLVALAGGDTEGWVEVLAQFQRASLFRIAIADFSDSLTIMQVSDRLTELAEIVLQSALALAWSDVSNRHGEPTFEMDSSQQKAGFGVIAYGKMGGIELSYRSDLDLVFLHDSHGSAQQTDGSRPLDNSRFFARLVQRLVHFLTTQTGSGAMYEVDTRLRPSGRSGMLVSSIEAFERYQEENAWTWEHQALLRSRPVAGSDSIARQFARIRSETLCSRARRGDLLQDVTVMRRKMRKQLDHSNSEQFDLKQGQGGIGDIEFIVQYLVLAHAAEQPELVHYSDNIRQLDSLQAAGLLDPETAGGLQQAYREYRLRVHHLVLDERKPLVAASEFAAQRKFVDQAWDLVMTP